MGWFVVPGYINQYNVDLVSNFRMFGFEDRCSNTAGTVASVQPVEPETIDHEARKLHNGRYV
jgi:hypothetical protein